MNKIEHNVPIKKNFENVFVLKDFKVVKSEANKVQNIIDFKYAFRDGFGIRVEFLEQIKYNKKYTERERFDTFFCIHKDDLKKFPLELKFVSLPIDQILDNKNIAVKYPDRIEGYRYFDGDVFTEEKDTINKLIHNFKFNQVWS